MNYIKKIINSFKVVAEICDLDLVTGKTTVEPRPFAYIHVTAYLKRKDGKRLSVRDIYDIAGKSDKVLWRYPNGISKCVLVSGVYVHLKRGANGVVNLSASIFDESNRVDDNLNGISTTESHSVTFDRCMEYAAMVQKLLPLF